MKSLFLMGATGSIGEQTLDIIRHHKEQFHLFAMSFNRNHQKALEIIDEFKPQYVVAGDKEVATFLEGKHLEAKVLYGLEGLIQVAKMDYQLLLNAVMGSVGLKPTMTAIENHKDIALANKETLVMAGDFVMAAAKKYGVSILPVDSEHSAIFQVMQGVNPKDVRSLTITASGGSFRDKKREELVHVTKEDALNHPNWSMGAKITIDSSTMVNKGLEVIEAHHLFGVPYDKINVILHRESAVHSMLTLEDGAIFAEIGPSDMRVPIQFALTYPRHCELAGEKTFDLAKIGCFHFEEMDMERFPMLALAIKVGRLGGSFPAVYNAANEVAVSAFLEDKISYLEIESLIERAVDNHQEKVPLEWEDLFTIDEMVRKKVGEWIRCRQD